MAALTSTSLPGTIAGQRQEKPPTTIDHLVQLPELAHALHSFLEPKQLAAACLVNKEWYRVWIPFLWQTFTLILPHPVLHQLPARRPQPPQISSGPFAHVSALTTQNYQRYALSEECLGRFGHLVRRLNAAWLNPEDLLRLSAHCLNLQQIKLAETLIPIRVIQRMLRPLTRLRRLDLDMPTEEFYEEEEENQDQDQNQDQDLSALLTANGPDENALFRSIEVCGSLRLEHLELTFQTSVRIPVKAFCSLLESHPALNTIKIVDADIEETIVRPAKKHGKGRKKKKSRDRVARGSLTPASASGSGSGHSTPMTSLSKHGSGSGEESSSTSSSLVSWALAAIEPQSFTLSFLAITSSHTSDTSLAYILERCPMLGALHLHSCDRVSDLTLETITQNLPELYSISLSGCKKLTQEGLSCFFKSTHRLLAHVHICDMAALHDDHLEILAKRHSPTLRKLAIYFCSFVTNKGIMAILVACTRLQVLGLQAYGMTTTIFEQPWACHGTLEHLDLQGVFKLDVEKEEGEGNDHLNNYHSDNGVHLNDFSATRVWRDRLARIHAYQITKRRLMTLTALKKLRLSAGGIGQEVLEGFGPQQRIEVLYLYGLQSNQVARLPWASIRVGYPFLKQVYCGVIGAMTQDIKDELARLRVELLRSSSIPNLAFENNFDDRIW